MVSATTAGILSKSGLTETELDAIKSVFTATSAITRVILFGSRAKGTAKPYSDIDLAIEGLDKEIEVAEVTMKLDELPLPYKFDVKPMTAIQHVSLKAHIKRVGMTIYRKNDDSSYTEGVKSEQINGWSRSFTVP